MRPADVAIVGGGVVGAAIALALARATRLRVVVLERGTPGCEASNAAAGVLAVASGQARGGALFELRRRSAALYPELVEGLEQQTGMCLGYQRRGLLSLAFSEAQAAVLDDLVQHRISQGWRCERLDRAAVLAAEPAVSAQVCAGARFVDDATIDSKQFVGALVAAARQRGVEWRLQTPVRSLRADGQAVTLRLEDGQLQAGTVVVSAGAWTSELLAGCGVKVPVRPARGEMAAVQSTPWRLRHPLSVGDTCLVPRGDGEVLIGSTMGFVGFDKRVSAAGLAELLTRAAQIVPAVRAAPLLRTWAGLRPCSTLRRPIIATLPGMDNVILATGHHRSGILLAPITAQLVCEMMGGAPPSVPLRPFSYRRH